MIFWHYESQIAISSELQDFWQMDLLQFFLWTPSYHRAAVDSDDDLLSYLWENDSSLYDQDAI